MVDKSIGIVKSYATLQILIRIYVESTLTHQFRIGRALAVRFRRFGKSGECIEAYDSTLQIDWFQHRAHERKTHQSTTPIYSAFNDVSLNVEGDFEGLIQCEKTSQGLARYVLRKVFQLFIKCTDTFLDVLIHLPAILNFRLRISG